MALPKVLLPTADRALVVGQIPRVVGTLSSMPDEAVALASKVPSDLVELRLDLMSGKDGWLQCGRTLQARGIPVILTIRLRSEGGKWTGPDRQRLKTYRLGLQHLSAVDVELRSQIAGAVSKAAKRMGKACIVSFHDFERTPRLPELKAILAEAERLASIVKISTRVRTRKDIEILRGLLQGPCKAPLCVIGMGPLGTSTRVSFAAEGSCLTYGYLDRPAAPGQMSAARLVERLRAELAKYDKDYLSRRRELAYA